MSRKFSLPALAAFMAISVASQAQTPAQTNAFIENKGQWDSQADFLNQLPDLNMWVTADGLVLDFHKFTRTNEVNPSPKLDRPEGVLQGQVVHMNFQNANQTAPQGANLQKAPFNYIRPQGTIKGVRRYGEALAANIYNGVSARYYLDHGAPRYDLVVEPGADPNQIAIKFDGANRLSVLSNGDLAIETSLGTVEQKGLAVYQGEEQTRTLVPSAMAVEGNTLRFQIGSYDKTQSLVIDPIIFSSYLGGGGGGGLGDKALSVSPAVDNNGVWEQYIAGIAESPDFPVTTGAYQTTLQPGEQGFLAQVVAATGEMNWCTFIQGQSLNDNANVEVNCVIADSSANAIIGGASYESTYPTTAGAYLTALPNKNVFCGFISKINSDGTTLMDSTYLSGTTNSTYIMALALSSVGNIMATGVTMATDFPTTELAFQTKNISQQGGFGGMAFASEISSDFKHLDISSYLGGSGANTGYALADGPQDSFIIAGTTTSTDFPVWPNDYQPTNPSGGTTGFIATVSEDAIEVLYGSYFGGSKYDAIYAMYVAPGGEIVFGGETRSTDLPAQGGFQPNIRGPQNGFIATMNSKETNVDSCTYLGGNSVDAIYGLCANGANSAYAVGTTISTNFPTTPSCYQPVGGVASTAFLASLDIANLDTFGYGSYYGAGTSGLAVSSDFSGNAVIAGTAGFIPTVNAYQNNLNSLTATNAFFADIQPIPETLTLKLPASVVSGQQLNGSFTLSSVASVEGATVNVASNYPAILKSEAVPVQPDVQSGQLNWTPAVVSSPTVVTVTATMGDETATATVTVEPYAVKSTVFSASKVVGGAEAVGTVTLAGPAGAVPMAVTLVSETPAVVQVPATMTIDAGKTSGTFDAITFPVNTASTVTVKATNGDGVTESAVIMVEPPVPSHLSFSPGTVLGGTSTVGAVSLDGNAGPAGAIVSLASHIPADGQVPATVTVPAGKSSATFTITTSPVNANAADEISATYNAVTVSANVDVDAASLSGVSLTSPTETGGLTDTGTVTLTSPAGASGLTMDLGSSNTALATVPSTILVSAGKSTATFLVKTFQVTTNSTVTITAKVGSAMKTTTLTLQPIVLSSLTVPVTSINGGASTTATINLSGPVGSTPLLVGVLSSNTAAANPQYTLVDFGTPGQSSLTFNVTTSPVNVPAFVTLTAFCNGVAQTASFTVNPAVLSTFTLNPTSIIGGNTSTGTITLTSPAGPAGVTVNLHSNSAAAKLPASISVLPGKSSATFTITTTAVKTTTPAIVTATWSTLAKTATLTISP